MKEVNGIRRCRLCATEEEFNNFINIFEDNPDLELESKITKLLPIVVMPWDPMPHIVCHMCIYKLNSFNEFYDASLKAERFLRTLHPSASVNQIEKEDTVDTLMEAPILNNNLIKLPPKKRQRIDSSSSRSRRNSMNDESELMAESCLGENSEDQSGKDLNCFIVNPVTSSDSVYTCRKCFRTFTRQVSALSHSCMRLENSSELEELGTEDEEDGTGKYLPPLKIRLFSVRSGLYVCYLCQSRFNEKTDVVAHIKGHFVDGQWGATVPRKPRQGGRRKGRQSEPKAVDDKKGNCKKNTPRGKRKPPSETPKRRSRAKSKNTSVESSSGCEKCGHSDNSPEKISPVVTVEQTTQYSDYEENEKKVNELEKRDEEIPPTEKDDIVKEPPAVVETPPAEESFQPNEIPLETSSEPEKPKELSMMENGDDPVEIPLTPKIDFAMEVTEMPEVDIMDDPVEIPPPEVDVKVDEIMVLEVINNKSPFDFLSCIFCDKIFSTKSALSSHRKRHLEIYMGRDAHAKETNTAIPSRVDNFLCCFCALMFTSQKTLSEHERNHVVAAEDGNNQKRIRIALNQKRKTEKELQALKRREYIKITVTAGEKKIPQIELI